MNFKISTLFFCFFNLFMLSCSTDDTTTDSSKSIQIDAEKVDLYGIWAIYKVKLEGVVQNVPINYETCGRDFFIYRENGFYEEFLFQESQTCNPVKNQYKWDLESGIITLSFNGQYEVFTINSLGENTLVFSASIDVDGDGIKEEYTFTALRYLPPNEIDIYTSSFSRKEQAPFLGHIQFDWDNYTGYNTFLRYEIYRSLTGCNINTAELLKTISDVNTSQFIDENPPAVESFCYFLRIYTDKGLLGESDPRYVATENIIPENVTIINTASNSNEVTVSWEKYTGYYFSHYEIRVQDQNENSNPNIETVAIIEDINVISFTDTNPPYVNNPVYSIYVHNIFGNVSLLDQNKNMTQTSFSRPELLDFDYIKFLSFDPDEQMFYFYAVAPDNERRLVKYNYINQNIVAEGFKLPASDTDVEMQLITSEEGKELIFEQGGDYWVYNSVDLTYKYALNPDFGMRDSFKHLDNNIWVFSDNNKIFTFRRTGSEMVKIDEKPHFSDHQSSMNYEITRIDNSNVLLSHNNEGRAIHFAISSDGFITNNGIIQIPLLATYNSDISVNFNASILLNKRRNTVYSTTDFSEIRTYTNPIITSNLNTSGKLIFGTNNFESSQNTDGFKKEIVVFNLEQQNIQKFPTKGYPLYIAEDSQGNIVSLSSGFPRDEYYDMHNDNVPDMFVEILE